MILSNLNIYFSILLTMGSEHWSVLAKRGVVEFQDTYE